ncbi:zinc ribbon domain-containing protein [Nannocystis exedens]|uniref:zinc ribbon domain-containing protein n=1 Tax=Nannocystis exedens TaxID=54 RepID=UPI0011811C8C|nr:C4-type zinc ribbon domain-containing protein [Nannocystis exedens]
MREIPSRIATLDTDLHKLEQMLSAERSKLDDTRSFQQRQEMQLHDEEDLIRSSKAKLGAIKTARELTAQQRELETTRRMVQTRTGEIGKLQEAVNKTEAQIAKMDAQLQALRQTAEAEKAKLGEEQARLGEQIDKAKKVRARLVKDIDRETLASYERIRKRLGGVAFVAAHRERCTACKMVIPHIMYTRLLKGREIPACESCGRLLYWSGHFPEDHNTFEAKKDEDNSKPKPAEDVIPGVREF